MGSSKRNRNVFSRCEKIISLPIYVLLTCFIIIIVMLDRLRVFRYMKEKNLFEERVSHENFTLPLIIIALSALQILFIVVYAVGKISKLYAAISRQGLDPNYRLKEEPKKDVVLCV